MIELLKTCKRKFQIYKVSTIFIVIGLIISFVVISFGTTVIMNYNRQNEITKEYGHKNQTYLRIIGKNEIDYNNIMDIIKKENNVSLEVNELYCNVKKGSENTVRGITAEYFNNDYEFNYPLLSGRKYTIEEINDGAKVAIVGKDINEKYVRTINDKRYIEIEKTLYEVIGVIGIDYDPLDFNGNIIIPALSIPTNTYEEINKNKTLKITLFNNKEETYNTYINIKKKIHDIDSSIGIQAHLVPELSIDVVSLAMKRTKKQVLMYLFSLVNCVIVSGYWINRRKYEIAIRKIFGYTNKEITMLLAKELFAIVLFSFLVSIVVQLLLGSIYNSITDSLFTFNYINLFVGLIFVVITTIITVVVPARMVVKMQPAEGIKKR